MRACLRWTAACLLLVVLLTPAHASLLFDGVDDRVDFGDLTAYDFANQTFTVAVHLVAPANPNGAYVLDRRISPGSAGGWMLRLEGSNVLRVRVLDVGNIASVERTTVSTIADGTFKSMVATLTTNTTIGGGNDVAIYTNGVFDTTGTGTANPYSPCPTGCPLTAGQISDLLGTLWFGGTIELIEIYPGGLSANEIATLGLSRLQRPGLSRARTVLWSLDQCTMGASSGGAIMRDRSGNGRDGTVSSGNNGTGATCTGSRLSLPWGVQ